MTKTKCKLCVIDLNSKTEKIYHKDNMCAVLDTIDKKGHCNRVMVMLLRHSEFPTQLEERHCRKMLRIVCNYIFINEPGYWIQEPSRFVSIPNHWHIIASDERKFASDSVQLSKTPKTWFSI
jgi:hypothetical protein